MIKAIKVGFIIGAMLVESLNFSSTYKVTEYRSEESAEFLWECLHKYAPNDYVAAGALAYFWRESEFRSDATAGWTSALACTGIDHCVIFTEQIDCGLEDGSTANEFFQTAHYQYGGYGLGQWSGSMLNRLYTFACDWGTSIADAEMQCAFLMQDIENEYPDLWEELLSANNPKYAGALIGKWYDGTSSYDYIGELALVYYKRFAV